MLETITSRVCVRQNLLDFTIETVICFNDISLSNQLFGSTSEDDGLYEVTFNLPLTFFCLCVNVLFLVFKSEIHVNIFVFIHILMLIWIFPLPIRISVSPSLQPERLYYVVQNNVQLT